MRSVVLILLPIALLAGVFYFLVSSRPAPLATTANPTGAGPATRKVVPTVVPNIDTSKSVVGQSGNVWVESLNKRTGKVASEFRSERFDPRQDGGFDVIFPQARFYGENGGIVTLEGSDGRVSLTQAGDRNDPQAMGTSSPTEGDLRDVIIRFYDESVDDEPTMVIQLPAVHFDAIGNRVSTVDSVIEGKGVLAEEVPINVRGRDVEFDGYGLEMSWNDRGGRLDNLEVHRGERLLIKNVEKFNLRNSSTAAPAASPAAYAIGSPSDLLVGLVAAPATEPLRRQQMYYATFDKDVRVNRDGAPLAAADVLRVILPLGDAKAVPAKVVANPETRAQRARRRAAATSPAAERALAAADDEKLGVGTPTTKPATHAASPGPTTAPVAGGPIEVLWSGKLTVLPVERVPDVPKDPVQTVELLGAPAWVADNGSRAEARLIHMEPDTGKIRLEPGGPVKAIAVHDARGADLRTRDTLLVDRAAGTATVNGGGTLIAPANPPTQPEATTISWSRRLGLAMSDSPQPTLQQVTLEGDAKIASATLDVHSDTLALGFGEPANRVEPAATGSAANVALPAADFSALRSVVAAGDASITVGKDAASRRTLAAQKIDLGFVPLDTGAGLKMVKCNDAVHLSDASGFSLACATLDATVKPTSIDKPADTSATQEKADPLADLDSMVATGAVSLKQADGSNAFGERMELTHVITAGGDTKMMTLTGAPASIGSAKGSLEGKLILIDPASGDVSVPGRGQFVGTGDASKDQPVAAEAPKPEAKMAVAWLESMNAVGTTGVCDLVGGVRIDGTSAAGTHLTARAQRGRINFTPRQQSSTSTTKSAAMADASLDAVRSVQLSGAVDVATEAADVRTSSIQTEQIDIDLENSIITAPQAGRLLVIDGQRATTQPTGEPATRGMKRGPGSLAVAWKQQLVWKMREGDLTFDGGVRLGFEKAGSNDLIRLTSDRVICALSPIQTGKGVDQMSQQIDLRTVTAQQHVSVRSRLASFDAASLLYDAVTNRATATGDPNTPVEVFDADATSRMSFSAITWNVETGLIEDFRDIDGRLRR